MLGQKSIHAEACYAGGFVGVDFGIVHDLKDDLPEDWRMFNHKFIPVCIEGQPDKSKIGAGLACGALWTVSKGIELNDIVLCPDGTGGYRLGEVVGDYTYHPGEILPHRRAVKWQAQVIDRSDMSQALKNSTGRGTICTITGHRDEIDRLIGGISMRTPESNEGTLEDPSAFAMEKHLEDFLVQNWTQTELGRDYDIYEEDGDRVGQQFPTDTGPLDILAISKDNKHLLVVELKKGRASDVVVGPISAASSAWCPCTRFR